MNAKVKDRPLIALRICFMLAMSQLASAEESSVDLLQKVHFIESDDAACIVNDGKLVSLALQDKSQALEVWVDRWFMQVQTADHTKQRLTAENPTADLGCSQTKAGSQHWTIHSVKILKDNV